MKKLLKKLAPDRFEDIIAVLALYRPGPLGSGMVPTTSSCAKGPAEDRLLPPRSPDRLPGADLRRDRISGTGDADLADHRRLHARRRRHAAPAMGKKKPRRWPSTGRRSPKAREEGLRPGAGRAAVRPDDQVRRSTASTSRTPPPTPWSPTTPPGSRRTTARRSWPRRCRPTWTTPIHGEDLLRRRHRLKLTVLGPDVNASNTVSTRSTARPSATAWARSKGTGEQAVVESSSRRARRRRAVQDLFDFCRASTSASSIGAPSRR